MNKYEVTIRDRVEEQNGFTQRFSMMFYADNFAHAEEQAIDAGLEPYQEIIKIEKDFD